MVKKLHGSWYFLIVMILVYALLFFFRSDWFHTSLTFFFNILLKIIPIFALIFVLMAISNYFISPKFIVKHLQGKGVKKWVYVILGGILSSGPIYMWYPLLSNLKKKGLRDGLIACFLYNRAIKIPLLPIAIFYFGLKYIVILTVVMILISVVQGILINKIMEVKNESSNSIRRKRA